MNEIITDFFSTENFKASLNSGRPTGTRGKNQDPELGDRNHGKRNYSPEIGDKNQFDA